MDSLREVKEMIKEYNQEEHQKERLGKVRDDFEQRVREVHELNFELKKQENRILVNMDDVWEKVKHEMQIISES